MEIQPGRSLLHYRILAEVGQGGMGEVYRAEDTKLGREVAIKVLPPALAADPERMARFEREARILAALDHPGIAAIYGLEHVAGRQVLVMQLVEGETLEERMARSGARASDALSIRAALEIAAQIAEALDAAHEQGIVHRDLKPANVKLTPDGKVKLLDFGLAKAFEAGPRGASGPGRDGAHSPTITSLGTVPGVILGTAAYMSPEQARGKPVDKRADIWAFGCVLYEMLAGRRPFDGETVSDTLAAILAREPDESALAGAIPAKVRELLQRCLEKDPKRRLRDIGDARLEIEAALAGRTASGRFPVATAPVALALSARAPLASPLVLVALAVAAVSLAIAAWSLRRTAPPAAAAPLVRLDLARPAGLGSSGPGSFALAPDGSAVVFAEGEPLYVREFDDPASREIAGTEDASFPFWSPDSRHLAFFADGSLKRVPRSGGAVQTVCEALNGRGGTWGSSGTIVFADGPFGALSKVDASGGAPEPATELDTASGETSHRFPSFLPDGRHFLYATLPEVQPNLMQVSVGSLDGIRGRPLLLSRTAARHIDPGYVIFTRDQALLAQRIEPRSLALVGDVVPLGERPQVQGAVTGSPVADGARNGTLVYDPIDARPTDLVWLGRDGRPIRTALRHPGVLGYPALSHRGDRLAATELSGTGRILWIADLASGAVSRLSRADRAIIGAAWTPDDERIVTLVTDAGKHQVISVDARGGSEWSALGPSVRWTMPGGVAPDGTILLDELVSERLYDIVVLPAGGNAATHSLVATPADERSGAVSPDGRHFAYSSTTSGRREVYVDTFPEPRGAIRVSTGGSGEQAWWRDDGREIYFVSADSSALLACDVRTTPALQIDKPRVLFDLPEGIRGVVAAPGGDRFLLLQPVGERRSSLVVVQNWAAQLEQPE